MRVFFSFIVFLKRVKVGVGGGVGVGVFVFLWFLKDVVVCVGSNVWFWVVVSGMF